MLVWLASFGVGLAVFAAAAAVAIQSGLSTAVSLTVGAMAAAVAIWSVLAGIGAE